MDCEENSKTYKTVDVLKGTDDANSEMNVEQSNSANKNMEDNKNEKSSEIVEEQFVLTIEHDEKILEETKSIKDVNSDETVIESSANIPNSMEFSEITISQENSPTSSNIQEYNISHMDTDKSSTQKSVNRLSTEKSEGASVKDVNKLQNVDENTSNKVSTEGEHLVNTVNSSTGENSNAPKFHKLKSKVKKRNYRNKRSTASDSGDTSNEISVDERINRIKEPNNSIMTRCTEDNEDQEEMSSTGQDQGEDADDSNEWTTASEDESEESTPACLKKQKVKSNFYIIPNLMKRELGIDTLINRRFYGSLHVVQHLELMYKLNEHQGCVNALNFNQSGKLLASGSDDLTVIIWDWAVGKKHLFFDSGHRSNLFQAKWLPLDIEYLMVTCARDGQVRLLDLRRSISRKIAVHHGASHKLSVHPDTPHVIISVGEDAKVFSIDIRESKPTKLLVVKDGTSNVQLYSVHSNPLNSNEFCVGGRSQLVRIYDRRKVSTPLYKLCPEHLATNKRVHVTCAVYNHNGTEILASYNDEDIYLFDTTVPTLGDFVHRYQGHRNKDTVKGVNFFGPKSEFILSGSDCGNIFIWDKNTEAIVQWMPGDEQGVVNHLEPHPYVPILATSGLDSDVKIWIPSSDAPPQMKNLEECVKLNLQNRALDSGNEPDAFDGQMFWILLRHIRHTERVRNPAAGRGSRSRNIDEDDGDASSNGDVSSGESDSESERNDVGRLQCPPS